MLAQARAQRRHRAGRGHHYLRHGFPLQISQRGRVDLYVALAGRVMRLARRHEEVGAVAIVFDQEGGPIQEAAKQLNDRPTVLHPVVGLQDQALVLVVV